MSWSEIRGLVPYFREAYLAEVGALAEALRAELEAGTMGNALDSRGAPDSDFDPLRRLEAACCERFGLEVTESRDERWVYFEGDMDHARLILLASPSARDEDADGNEGYGGIGGLDGWNSECDAAKYAVALDVIRTAEKRGWTRRTA
jgi:hypothetical protein